MDTQIHIGVFAHNEADGIAGCVAALRAQSIFNRHPVPRVTILENGSTDETVQRAEAALKQHFDSIPASVLSLEVGDKGLTWNSFIHESSEEFLICMDADIEPGHDDVLQQLVTALENNPHAWASVSRPVKDIAKYDRQSRLQKLSIAGSVAGEGGPTQLCGQLYCGRAELLRRIYLPAGLLVEDGFLRAMITTNCFREPEDISRIVSVPGAFHYFEAVTQLQALFKHEKRLAVGTELNIMLFGWASGLIKEGVCVSSVVSENNQKNLKWVGVMAGDQIARKSFKFHSWEYSFKQVRSWKTLAFGKRLKSLPGFIAHIGLNAVATLAARKALKRGQWHW